MEGLEEKLLKFNELMDKLIVPGTTEEERKHKLHLIKFIENYNNPEQI